MHLLAGMLLAATASDYTARIVVGEPPQSWVEIAADSKEACERIVRVRLDELRRLPLLARKDRSCEPEKLPQVSAPSGFVLKKEEGDASRELLLSALDSVVQGGREGPADGAGASLRRPADDEAPALERDNRQVLARMKLDELPAVDADEVKDELPTARASLSTVHHFRDRRACEAIRDRLVQKAAVAGAHVSEGAQRWLHQQRTDREEARERACALKEEAEGAREAAERERLTACKRPRSSRCVTAGSDATLAELEARRVVRECAQATALLQMVEDRLSRLEVKAEPVPSCEPITSG
jgi:hypothetical protein